jgi:hypothetical protein
MKSPENEAVGSILISVGVDWGEDVMGRGVDAVSLSDAQAVRMTDPMRRIANMFFMGSFENPSNFNTQDGVSRLDPLPASPKSNNVDFGKDANF